MAISGVIADLVVGLKAACRDCQGKGKVAGRFFGTSTCNSCGGSGIMKAPRRRPSPDNRSLHDRCCFPYPFHPITRQPLRETYKSHMFYQSLVKVTTMFILDEILYWCMDKIWFPNFFWNPLRLEDCPQTYHWRSRVHVLCVFWSDRRSYMQLVLWYIIVLCSYIYIYIYIYIYDIHIYDTYIYMYYLFRMFYWVLIRCLICSQVFSSRCLKIQ